MARPRVSLLVSANAKGQVTAAFQRFPPEDLIRSSSVHGPSCQPCPGVLQIRFAGRFILHAYCLPQSCSELTAGYSVTILTVPSVCVSMSWSGNVPEGMMICTVISQNCKRKVTVSIISVFYVVVVHYRLGDQEYQRYMSYNHSWGHCSGQAA